jgi:hypothetical protein
LLLLYGRTMYTAGLVLTCGLQQQLAVRVVQQVAAAAAEE